MLQGFAKPGGSGIFGHGCTVSSKKSLRRATRHIATRCLAPYGRSSQWHCFTAPEALSVYDLAARCWDLSELSPLKVPYSGVWHVSAECPVGVSPGLELRWTTVSEVSSGLCAHCAVLLSFSLSIPGLTDSSTDWVVSPLAEALLVVLLYSIATSKLRSTRGLPGWITQTARQAQSSLGGSLVIEEALKLSLKKRLSLLRQSGVYQDPRSSLVAPFETRAGGVLLLSDEAYVKDSFVVLPRAATYVASREELHEAVLVEISDRSTLDVFVSLLVSGLDDSEASRAATALTGHSALHA